MVIGVDDIIDRVRAIPDPELPWVNIGDLGVLREVSVIDGRVAVVVTPTWTGCPAMDAIRDSIRSVLQQAGFEADQIAVNTHYSPAWSTDHITEAGRRKLAAVGIAPPRLLADQDKQDTRCPRCESSQVRQVSEFGATACKALMACRTCLEPFDRFKEL